MEAKLKKITTQYHTFEDNQVLTKNQLNEFSIVGTLKPKIIIYKTQIHI